MSNFNWIANTEITSSEIGDELALLEPTTGQYFTLNQTGSFVWQHLSEPRSTDEIILAVADKFDISATDCEIDISDLIAQLSKAGLIRKA